MIDCTRISLDVIIHHVGIFKVSYCLREQSFQWAYLNPMVDDRGSSGGGNPSTYGCTFSSDTRASPWASIIGARASATTRARGNGIWRICTI